VTKNDLEQSFRSDTTVFNSSSRMTYDHLGLIWYLYMLYFIY